MSRNIKIIMFYSSAAALLLFVAFSALQRAGRARDERLDWEAISRILDTRGYQQAIGVIDQRLAGHPKDSLLLYYKARVYYSAGFAREALEQADLAIKLGYAQEISHLLKALVYGRLNSDFAKQKELASKALTYDPAYDEAYIIRAEAEFMLGEFKACAADAASYTRMRPKDSWGYETSLLCREALKDYAGAEKAGLKALELKPKNHAAYWRLGLVYAGQGLHKKAIKNYSEAIRASGGRPQYFLARARSCEAAGDFSCAAWDYYSAMDWREVSGYASYYYLLGSGMHRINELKYALNAAEAAVKLDPTDPDYYELRGRVYAEKGEAAAAKKDLLKASSLSPAGRPEADRLLAELKNKK
ncbi:MAG TPA: hypothetical protein DCZ92_14165 [Elusimicrobia bacterium]|nr:MAG: hypothetical protein A2016_03385 [Elusimicrobia bacterium GWF2_62_30]HBA61927.1 hypothetical protein [Elusimicrobiota bacterium]